MDDDDDDDRGSDRIKINRVENIAVLFIGVTTTFNTFRSIIFSIMFSLSCVREVPTKYTIHVVTPKYMRITY